MHLFYLKLTYLDLVTQYIPPFLHSFPTSSSPEKLAPSTEFTVRIILIAQRNASAFMEVSIFKTFTDSECFHVPAVDAKQLLEWDNP